MQIHYLWVRHSSYLDEASINLSSRFIFVIENDNSNETAPVKKLTITFNPDYIDNFFDNKQISNVTAIIGKNGAGKSSILKYIRSHLPDGTSTQMQHDIIAFSINDDDDSTLALTHPNNMGLDIDDMTGLFKIQSYDDLPAESFRAGMPPTDFIHYSYFLEYKENSSNWNGLRNISTTALLSAARNRIIEENIRNPRVQEQLLTKTSDLENLYLDEVARAIQFFGSPDSKKLPFERPEELTVEINLDDSLYFEDNKAHQGIEDLLQILYARNTWGRSKEGFINNLLLAIFINFQIDERKYATNNPSTYAVEIRKDESAREYILRFFSEMKGYTQFMESRKVDFTRYNLLTTLVPEFVGFMESLLAPRFIKVSVNSTQVAVPLNEETEETFQRLRDYYLKIKGISTFFNFRWRSLSTGEQSYLSFMSRFYHVKHHEHNELKSNLVIMIDEGDACYHPEWQRRFFNVTLDYLGRLFAGHSIQLIFTANTPFLSSDLPKSNVLFIEKKIGIGSVYHSKRNDQEQTFAANIHTLYSNSFYMNGILIGEFAKQKLDKIIKYLNDKEQTRRIGKYKKTIDMIGEPVLRKKLQAMWSEKFGLNEERIRLQQRIDEINKIMEDNNTDI
nr:ATP-binding protein [Mucilaginibacter sp. L294]